MSLSLRTLCTLVATLSAVVAACARPSRLPADGTTVAGRVLCEGKPVAGVTVSDGVLFATTDSLGRYALASKKFQGAVFVITPSGYEPVCKKGVLPQFWARLKSNKPDVAEQHDFELRRVNQHRHRMIFSADMHLANRCDDLRQLKDKYIPAVREAVAEARRDSIPVYSLILGDLSSSAYWYSSEFDVGDALNSIVASGYPAMLYTTMGEQDYDGSVPAGALTDYKAERIYVYSCGPRYYSFNVGNVHYVVFDNTVFRNDAGDGKYPAEIVGKRNCDRLVSAEQLAWLRHDLALVEDKTAPVVVCMHHNAFRVNGKGSLSCTFSEERWLDSLTSCFRSFANVHFFTGHSHRKRLSESAQLPNITEHDLPSASGNAWATAFDGFAHVCPDGTDPGFEVCDICGNDLRWQYRTELHGNRTFRTYDMSEVGKYYRANSDVRNFVKEYPDRIDYGAESFGGYVYINWWGYEPRATLEVWEGDRPLKVKRTYQDDPLYTVASDVFRLKNSRGRKPAIRKNNCLHLFRVKPESDSTILRIRTTDRFGVVFEEQMTRPKAFSATDD